MPTSLFAVNNTFRRNAALLSLVVGSALAGTPGCASRADLVDVRQMQGQMRAALADQNQEIEDLKRRYEALRSQQADPRGGRPVVAQPSDHVLRWLEDLSRRVAALEQAQGIAAGSPPPGSPLLNQPPVVTAPGGADVVLPPALPPQPPSAPAAASSPMQAALAREEASLQGKPLDPDYAAAVQQIRDGDCKQAVGSLRSFVRKSAKSQLADNAQYWIGSCYYQQKDFNRAIIELNEVLLKYPKGDKVPGALLLLADAFRESGDPIDARLILQKLISDHPTSDEAQQGKSKLQALGD